MVQQHLRGLQLQLLLLLLLLLLQLHWLLLLLLLLHRLLLHRRLLHCLQKKLPHFGPKEYILDGRHLLHQRHKADEIVVIRVAHVDDTLAPGQVLAGGLHQLLLLAFQALQEVDLLVHPLGAVATAGRRGRHGTSLVQMRIYGQSGAKSGGSGGLGQGQLLLRRRTGQGNALGEPPQGLRGGHILELPHQGIVVRLHFVGNRGLLALKGRYYGLGFRLHGPFRLLLLVIAAVPVVL